MAQRRRCQSPVDRKWSNAPTAVDTPQSDVRHSAPRPGRFVIGLAKAWRMSIEWILACSATSYEFTR